MEWTLIGGTKVLWVWLKVNDTVKVGKTIPGLGEIYLTTNDLDNYHISIHTIIWIIEGNYLKVKMKEGWQRRYSTRKNEKACRSLSFPFSPLAFHHGECLVSFLQTGRGFVLSTEIYWSVWTPVIHPSAQNDINERLLFSCCNLAPNFKMSWRVKLSVAKDKFHDCRRNLPHCVHSP